MLGAIAQGKVLEILNFESRLTFDSNFTLPIFLGLLKLKVRVHKFRAAGPDRTIRSIVSIDSQLKVIDVNDEVFYLQQGEDVLSYIRYVESAILASTTYTNLLGDDRLASPDGYVEICKEIASTCTRCSRGRGGGNNSVWYVGKLNPKAVDRNNILAATAATLEARGICLRCHQAEVGQDSPF